MTSIYDWRTSIHLATGRTHTAIQDTKGMHMGTKIGKRRSKRMRFLKVFSLLTILTCVWSDPLPTHAQDSKETQQRPSESIGSGDLLDVVFYVNADLSSKCRVNESGEITLP